MPSFGHLVAGILATLGFVAFLMLVIGGAEAWWATLKLAVRNHPDSNDRSLDRK